MGRWTKIFLGLGLAGILSYGGARFLLRWHETEVDRAVEQERRAAREETGRLKAEVTELRKALALKEEPTLPEERLKEVFGGETGGGEKAEDDCGLLERRLREWYRYLDGRPYLRGRLGRGGAEALFRRTLQRLSEHPPEISGEMKDPYLLVRNVAHFYRVLGKEDVRLIAEILARESDVAEPVAALFFDWLTSGGRCGEGLPAPPSLEVLYDYAGFFLNTLAGKSYLLRREGTIRLLVSYYGVLLLDRADREGINRQGIDVRSLIDTVAREIRESRCLARQQAYLKTLEGLRADPGPP